MRKGVGLSSRMPIRTLFWAKLIAPLSQKMAARPKRQIEIACLLLVAVTASLDYLTGRSITLDYLYAVPIVLAAWFVGRGGGLMVMLPALGLWSFSDLASGLYSSIAAILINATMRLVFFGLLVTALARLAHLQRNLERRAIHRARALSRAAQERQRLEQEMLEISEREQRRVGRDLHDGLCQHLLATAFAGQALVEKLNGHPEHAGAGRVLSLVQQAIQLARGLAKGLHPVGMEGDGLMQALEDFAANVSGIFGVNCRFVCHGPVLVKNQATATHLYRIAQEAVSNAITHGHAREIAILLDENEDGILLAVSDDGQGFLPVAVKSGMGLRIMADRAKMMGGRFQVMRGPKGMELSCRIPATERVRHA